MASSTVESSEDAVESMIDSEVTISVGKGGSVEGIAGVVVTALK